MGQGEREGERMKEKGLRELSFGALCKTLSKKKSGSGNTQTLTDQTAFTN